MKPRQIKKNRRLATIKRSSISRSIINKITKSINAPKYYAQETARREIKIQQLEIEINRLNWLIANMMTPVDEIKEFCI